MIRRIAAAALALAGGIVPAAAGFQAWTAEVEDDPFSQARRVVVTFMDTLRSGALIFCESDGDGLRVRAVPGWAYNDDLDGYEPLLEFAIDGKRLGSASGVTGAVGDNQAVSEAELVGSMGRSFGRAFTSARRQIAIKDGISNRPLLFSAKGSTASGRALMDCLRAQPGWVE